MHVKFSPRSHDLVIMFDLPLQYILTVFVLLFFLLFDIDMISQLTLR